VLESLLLVLFFVIQQTVLAALYPVMMVQVSGILPAGLLFCS
jgi:hypothetical protein